MCLTEPLHQKKQKNKKTQKTKKPPPLPLQSSKTRSGRLGWQILQTLNAVAGASDI